MSEPALQETTESSPPPLVTLLGVGPQLVISLDKDAPFEQLRDEVRRVFGENPGRFKGTTARLAFGARELSLFDLRRLVHLLRDEHEVLVAGIQITPESLHRWAEVELKLKVYLTDLDLEEEDEESLDEEATVEPAERAPELVVEPPPLKLSPPVVHEPPATPPELAGAHRMLPVERTVRSGTTIRFPGDIVVYGDINAGAVVVATGNILVLGRLSGLAHAGADGDERAVVIGFDLRPTQVRIGKKIAIAPDRQEAPPKARSPLPEIAWVSGDTIVIEEYRGRLPG